MISFVVGSPYFASDTTVTLDRDPVLEGKIRKLTQKASDYPMEHARIDGINHIEETVRFTINSRPLDYIQSLNNYFKSLKGTGTMTLTFPNSVTKKLVINSWNITILNYYYASIQVEGELVFL